MSGSAVDVLREILEATERPTDSGAGGSPARLREIADMARVELAAPACGCRAALEKITERIRPLVPCTNIGKDVDQIARAALERCGREGCR